MKKMLFILGVALSIAVQAFAGDKAKFDAVEASTINGVSSNALTAGAAAGTVATNVFTITEDPSGWSGDTDAEGTYTFTTNTRVLSITNGTALTVYRDGIVLTNGTSFSWPAIGTNSGLWYLYWSHSTSLQVVNQTGWSLDDIQAATVYYTGGTNGEAYLGQESHGFMPWTVHRRWHLVEGSKYADGLTLTATNPYVFSMSSGNWLDEDILHAVSTQTTALVMGRTNSITPRFLGPRATYVITNGTGANLCYDLNGTNTLVPTGGGGNYVNYWLYTVPLANTDLLWVQGRLVSGTLATVQAETPYDLTGLFPAAEGVLIYRVTLRNSNPPVVTSISDYRKSQLTATSYSPTTHNVLAGRDAADAHPLASITGYETLLTTNGSAAGLTNFPTAVWYTPLSEFTFTGGKITAYSGTNAEVRVPPYNGTNAVTIIGDSSFYGKTNLKVIVLPDSVVDIEPNAFNSCYVLAYVSMPGVTNIGINAFQDDVKLSIMSFPSVVSIGQNAFFNCSGLTSMSFPKATLIDASVFYNCSILSYVSIPSVTSIGANAFYGCVSLLSISLPSVTSIGNTAFNYCTSLASVYFSKNAPTLGTTVFANTAPAVAYYPQGRTGYDSWGYATTNTWVQSDNIYSLAVNGAKANASGNIIVTNIPDTTVTNMFVTGRVYLGPDTNYPWVRGLGTTNIQFGAGTNTAIFNW